MTIKFHETFNYTFKLNGKEIENSKLSIRQIDPILQVSNHAAYLINRSWYPTELSLKSSPSQRLLQWDLNRIRNLKTSQRDG